MAFAENALFESSGVICQSPVLFSFPDNLPRTEETVIAFLLTKILFRCSDSSYNTTDLSLIILKIAAILKGFLTSTFC